MNQLRWIVSSCEQFDDFARRVGDSRQQPADGGVAVVFAAIVHVITGSEIEGEREWQRWHPSGPSQALVMNVRASRYEKRANGEKEAQNVLCCFMVQ